MSIEGKSANKREVIKDDESWKLKMMKFTEKAKGRVPDNSLATDTLGTIGKSLFLTQCESYLTELGFKKVEFQSGSYCFEYTIPNFPLMYRVSLYSVESKYLRPEFPHEYPEGSIIFSSETYNDGLDDPDDVGICEVGGIIVTTLDEVKFLVEKTGRWRQFQVVLFYPNPG